METMSEFYEWYRKIVTPETLDIDLVIELSKEVYKKWLGHEKACRIYKLKARRVYMIRGSRIFLVSEFSRDVEICASRRFFYQEEDSL